MIGMLLPPSFARKLGLKSARDRRLEMVAEQCVGYLLDIGCGEGNLLVKSRNDIGIGVDKWHFDDRFPCRQYLQRFSGSNFHTISLVASLNHIIDRSDVLEECHRLLKQDGRLVITMINPILGWIRHATAWWDKDGVGKGELNGMWSKDVVSMAESKGFKLQEHRRFALLNHLFVFVRR